MTRNAYLTPNAPVGEQTVWKAMNVHVAPVEIQALFSGAINSLFHDWMFEQFGEMTPEETAQYFRDRPIVDDLCSAINDCINNGALDEALGAFMNRWAQENGYFPSDPTKFERDTTVTIPSDTSVINDTSKCNNDQLFGQATELTDYMHALIEDVMEFLEYAATQIEFTQDVTGIIPLFGKATEFVTGFAEWMFNNMANGYQAGYTTALRDDIRCDLFCLMKDDCQLTFDELANYFAGKASITIVGQNIEQIAAQLVNILDGTTIVYAMHGVLAGILRLGGEWAGVTSVTSLQTALALGANNPDGDWALLCDECAPQPECPIAPQQIIVSTFQVTDHPCIQSISFVPDTTTGLVGSLDGSIGNPSPSFKCGTGIVGAQYGYGGAVRIEFKRTISLDKLQFDLRYNNPSGIETTKPRARIYFQGSLISAVGGSTALPRNQWVNSPEWDFNTSVDEIQVELSQNSAGWDASTQPLEAFIDNIRITENGYTP